MIIIPGFLVLLLILMLASRASKSDWRRRKEHEQMMDALQGKPVKPIHNIGSDFGRLLIIVVIGFCLLALVSAGHVTP